MEEITLKDIKKYATSKMVVLITGLVIASVSVILMVIGSLMLKNNLIDIKIVGISVICYVVSMIISIKALSYYDKKREKLINKVDIKSLKIFFEYFNTVKKKNHVYCEVKDIFMYGLWKLKDNNSYLKFFSETDITETDFKFKKGKINKKEFMASSIFRCLTYSRDGIVYRNQHIFCDDEKFSNIINSYYEIYRDNKKHTKEYKDECEKIEQEYLHDKKYAKEHYKGFSNEIGKIERFVNFSNNPEMVKLLKKILAGFAIVGVFIQPINDYWNEMVTILYNGITIVLLLVDVAQKDEEKVLH